MKKTELKNCPQWLLDANTENEDVDFDKDGILVWRGGNFRGGDFLGGDFLGGDFRGGNFLGGDFRGEKLNHKPISIYGLEWMILITGAQMQIGCQCHSHTDWRNFDESQIKNMHLQALEFWRINKTFLLSICDHEAEVTRYIDSKNLIN